MTHEPLIRQGYFKKMMIRGRSEIDPPFLCFIERISELLFDLVKDHPRPFIAWNPVNRASSDGGNDESPVKRAHSVG